MNRCVVCGGYEIKNHLYRRDGSDSHLCDVCYWRKRYNAANERAEKLQAKIDESQKQAPVPSDYIYVPDYDENTSMVVDV